MDKYGWKLLKAIFFVCSSICPLLMDFIGGSKELSWLGIIGIIGMVIGLFMGWSALIGHCLNDSQRKNKS